MKVGLISTLSTNVGDDFIRDGIEYIVRRCFGDEVTFLVINKHRPLQAISPVLDSLMPKSTRLNKLASSMLGPSVGRHGRSVFDDCDLIIQCGAPIMWHGCSRSEWSDLIWRGVLSNPSRNVPLLNIAGGSCFPMGFLKDRHLSESDKDFIKLMGTVSQATTVRDDLAALVFHDVGIANVPVIPCTAFLAALRYRESVDYAKAVDAPIDVVFNYMRGAGHFDFDGSTRLSQWDMSFRAVYDEVRRRGLSSAFICHSQDELVDVRLFDPNARVLEYSNRREYFERISSARVALVNRLHAAVAFAGARIPSIAVGTDTRLLMVRQLGLPAYMATDLPVTEILVDELLSLRVSGQADRLVQLQRDVEEQYGTLFSAYGKHLN